MIVPRINLKIAPLIDMAFIVYARRRHQVISSLHRKTTPEKRGAIP